MSLLGDFIAVLGESKRIKNTAGNEASLSEENKKKLNCLRNEANAGNVEAMFTLGNLYYNGEDIGYDPEMACKYWEEAAKHGHITAMYNVGLMYMGEVSKFIFNDEKAGEWLEKAARYGDQRAADILEESFKYNKRAKKWMLVN